MTPRIIRTGAIVADGRDVEINDGDALHVVVLATPDESEAARVLGELHRVRVTIEPVEPEAPPPGDPLDYLAQARAIIADGTLDALCGPSARDTLARLESLLNTVYLATVAQRRRSTS